MGTIIYQKKSFIIFKAKGGFVVYNKNKDFQVGHTHMKSYKKAKSLIYLASKNKTPNCESIRFLYSLLRISEDEIYTKNIKEKIGLKIKKKKLRYYNRCNFLKS